jgi:deoxyadenosine/deoxycytidine kinase
MEEATWTAHHRQTESEAALAARAKGRIVIIEGLNGVGKTTATGVLASWARRCLGLEAVALSENMRQPLLTYFCAAPKERALATQLTMLCKRIFEMVEAAKAAQRGAIVFMDRSIAGDLAFALMHHGDGNISQEGLEVYKDEREALLVKLRALGEGYWPTMAAALLFQAPTPILKERIVRRGDPKEIDLYCIKDPTYLDRLGAAYDKAMKPNVLGCPVMAVDWLEDHPNFVLADKDCEQLLRELLDLGQVPLAGGPEPAQRRTVATLLDWGGRRDAFERELAHPPHPKVDDFNFAGSPPAPYGPNTELEDVGFSYADERIAELRRSRLLDANLAMAAVRWGQKRPQLYRENLERYKQGVKEEEEAMSDATPSEPTLTDLYASGPVSEADDDEMEQDPWDGQLGHVKSHHVSRLD